MRPVQQYPAYDTVDIRLERVFNIAKVKKYPHLRAQLVKRHLLGRRSGHLMSTSRMETILFR